MRNKSIFLIVFTIYLISCSCIRKYSTDINDLSETVTDIDGNVYNTIRIGDQVWLSENLKVTHYRNGDEIPNIFDETQWANLITGAWCAYNNDLNNITLYGLLYNWFVIVDSRDIVLEGWHVPTDEDWQKLEIYLGMSLSEAENQNSFRGTNEGGKLKEKGSNHWMAPNVGATNETGFTILPGGNRSVGTENAFFDRIGSATAFWTSTECSNSRALVRSFTNRDSTVGRYDTDKKRGLSIRLIKN